MEYKFLYLGFLDSYKKEFFEKSHGQIAFLMPKMES